AQDAMGSLEHGHRNDARERPKVPDASRSASPAVAPIPTFPRKRGKESRWRLPPRKRGKEQAQAPSPATRGRAGAGARGIATGTTGLRQLPPSRPSPARGGKEQVVAPSPQAGEGVGDGRCPNPETGAGRRRSDAATPHALHPEHPEPRRLDRRIERSR